MTLTKKEAAFLAINVQFVKVKPQKIFKSIAAAAKLCKIYEEIVRTYSEINGGNDDWINETGVRGNEAEVTTVGFLWTICLNCIRIPRNLNWGMKMIY